MRHVDYPEEADLERIRTWPVEDLAGLFEFIADIWIETYGIMSRSTKPSGRWGSPDRNGPEYELITGGWSGNEDIIAALEANTLCYTMTWQLTQRGGRHVFRLPEP